MVDKVKSADDLNTLAARNPAVGDMWEDHLVKVLLVVKVTPTHVLYVKTTRHPRDPDFLCWDYQTVRCATPAEFTAIFYVGEGHSTWASVHRGMYLSDIPPDTEWIMYTEPTVPSESAELQALRKQADRLGYRLVAKN